MLWYYMSVLPPQEQILMAIFGMAVLGHLSSATWDFYVHIVKLNFPPPSRVLSMKQSPEYLYSHMFLLIFMQQIWLEYMNPMFVYTFSVLCIQSA